MAPAALLAFAGKSLAAAVIKEIIAKAFRYLDDYFTAETLEEMKNKLDEGMMQIQAVLEVVSPDHIEDRGEALDQWLWKLRDAVEVAEDAIDELEYYELEERAKYHQVSDRSSNITKAKHKVITSVKHVPILDKSVKQFTHRGTLKRLKKAIESIDKAAADAATFLEVVKFRQGQTFGRSRQEGIRNSDRQTGSTSTVTKFVGRENEKKLILEWLTKKTTVEEGAGVVISPVYIPIFSLIGHGGMGKTTLAQTMCEHDEVAKDFKIIWVTVSTGFDATSVTRKILESITRKTPKTDSLEPLQQDLKDKLKSFNRFLLILDDVWEDGKRNEWEKLFAPLRTMKSRSKILLTTRMASVATTAADVMGVARESLTLKELEGENLELFNHHIFSGLNSQDYSELKAIGEQIARKLKGCPLVIKVVSGHLQGNMTSEFWERFLCEGDLNDFTGISDDIMKVLRISYYHLPTELQTCFRYCSIFPQDYRFTSRELTMLWIGSGLISIRENETKSHEEIVEQYLFQLWTKSFFDKKINQHGFPGPSGEHYVLHDLMHDLAKDVSSGECKRISSPNRLVDVEDRIRHLHIEKAHDPNVDNFRNIVQFKNLRTLVISSDSGGYISKQMQCIISKALENSRAVRLIRIISSCPFKFPRKTSNLKHLRAVIVSKLVPESVHVIHKLYHLMVLRVNNHLEIGALSLRNLGGLDRLRYISYDTLGQVHLNRLTSLQELKNYQVQGSRGNKISDIGNLKYLQELEVKHPEKIENIDDAMNAKMKEKKHLTSLSLSWSTTTYDTGNRIDDLVLDLFEPHANIGVLTIRYHGGQRPPFWINGPTFKKLVSFELIGCMNWEYLPCLEEFVLLRHLTLISLPMLQQIGRPSVMASSCSMEYFLPPNLYSV